jgi:hypothetical protein
LVKHYFYKIEDFSGKPGLLFAFHLKNTIGLSIEGRIAGCARLA